MKKNALIFLSLLAFQVNAQDVWTKRDSVNGPPRAAAAAFVLGEEAFVVTGVNVEEFKRKMYSYNPEQDDWDNEAALGGSSGSGLARSSAIGFSAGGHGYVGLGSGAAAYMKDMWRYDHETETWTQVADFAGSARNGAVAFSIDDRGYVGTGQDADGLKDDFYQYSPETNTWSQIASFPGGERKEAVGFTMGGKAYLGTGRGSTIFYADFWEYSPVTDEWTRKADFPGTPRMGAVGCGVFPSAFIMTGEDNTFNYCNDVWEYHYFGDVWTQRANYPGGTRTQATAVVVDNRIFVGLGYNGIYHDDFYEYEQILTVPEVISENDITLFPNPASQYINIRFPASWKAVSVVLHNAAGQEMANDQYTISTMSAEIRLTLDSLPVGHYHLTLLTDNNKITKSFTIR